ncbi:MAG TPA: enoyl-CoA hydratase [Candidatus Acidoferrales bacterium]|nr:enoyl-CoA hydratase [Candidatus Acidoferrales bacterium]
MTEAVKSVGANVLLEERHENILTLRLNRPDRLNALNIELGEALVNALGRAADDSSVRAVVLTGAGRAFCAGGDLALLRDARMRNAANELESLVRSGKEISLLLATMSKPVIASVNGPAAGGGANLALGCDLRIASDSATFGESFAKIGLYPDFGGTYHLPRLVGPAIAAELFYTGEMISAEEAYRIGIFNHVVPADRLAEDTHALAANLASGPPVALELVKERLFTSDRPALERALDQEIARQVQCFSSEDCAEGLAAFFEKRRPQFRGK